MLSRQETYFLGVIFLLHDCPAIYSRSNIVKHTISRCQWATQTLVESAANRLLKSKFLGLKQGFPRPLSVRDLAILTPFWAESLLS